MLLLLPWRWRRHGRPKRRFVINTNGWTSQKTAFFIVTAVKASNSTWQNKVSASRNPKKSYFLAKKCEICNWTMKAIRTGACMLYRTCWRHSFGSPAIMECAVAYEFQFNSIQFNLFMFHNIHNRPGLTGKVTSQIKSCTPHLQWSLK
jgi:hypothetical protein